MRALNCQLPRRKAYIASDSDDDKIPAARLDVASTPAQNGNVELQVGITTEMRDCTPLARRFGMDFFYFVLKQLQLRTNEQNRNICMTQATLLNIR